MAELMINSAVTHSLLVLLPVACALLLRRARCPGAGVLGGAVAGLLLGPGVLGRIAPDLHEAHFTGGRTERIERDLLVRRHAADEVAATAAGTSGEARRAMEDRHGRERAAAETALRDARWHFQRPFRSYTSAVVVLALLGAGLLRRRETSAQPGLVAPASIGVWSAVLPGSIAFAAALRGWGAPAGSAAVTAAAVGIGPWILTRVDREAADAAEIGGARLVRTAGRIASVIAVPAAMAGLLLEGATAGVLWSLPLLALPAGWLLPPIPGADDPAPARLAPARIARGVLDTAVVPSLAACLAVTTDPQRDFAIWPFLVIVILSGDGRWLGALLGALLPGGRRGLRTMRLVLGSMAAGPTQLAVAAIAARLGALPHGAALALLAGAVVVEVSSPLRRSFAAQLVRTEEESPPPPA